MQQRQAVIGRCLLIKNWDLCSSIYDSSLNLCGISAVKSASFDMYVFRKIKWGGKVNYGVFPQILPSYSMQPPWECAALVT